MKLFIYFLLVGLCVASANVLTSIEGDEFEDLDYEFIANDLAEDVSDIDAHVISPWLGIFFIIDKALLAVKGVKCTLKEVVSIKDAAQTFLGDMQLCGDGISANAKKLIQTCENIVTNANNIIYVNVNVCGGTSTPTAVSEDELFVEAFSSTTNIKCFFKLVFKTLKLKIQIRQAIYLIKHIPKVPGQANACVNNAPANLGNLLNQFPYKIKNCA